MRRHCKAVLLLVLLGCAASGRTQTEKRPVVKPAQVLREYFDLLATGNDESANYMWVESDQERSGRFGITFTDIPLKIDASSPIIRNLDQLQDNLSIGVKGSRQLTDGFYRLQFSTVVESRLIEYNYLVQQRGNWYWLTYPQDYYARTWPVKESKYLRIHVHPAVEPYLNPAALEESDRFVAAVADSLGLTRAQTAEIEDRKIEFFYCDSDSTVKLITGARSKGTLDLASNDIISASFPHFHEVVHLLVNIKLHALPFYTLPLMREGLAVRFGGRWGKSESALNGLGIYLYRERLVELDSILTLQDFSNTTGADIAYPVAGLFSGFLLERLGLDRYLEVYRGCSGSQQELSGLTIDSVKARLSSLAGFESWPALVAGFDAYLETIESGERMAAPGDLRGGSRVVSTDSCRVVRDREWVAYEFTPKSKPPVGTIFFGKDERLVGHKSHLFEEQFGDSLAFAGYRYAVRYDQFEAGLYDYATNELIAKYIFGINPPGGYFDAEANRVTIKFRRSLTDGVLPFNGDYKLIAK